MATSEQDIMEDLAYAEAEGPADMFESEGDSLDGFESDGLEDMADAGAEDPADMYEDGIEAAEAEEFIGNALGSMLGAESEDEFLGKLFSGVKNIVKKVAPVVGSIARGAAPILSAIPLPQAQLAGKVAGLLGNLRAEGASVEDALEAVAEVAARDRRALPIVAGLAARSLVKNRGAMMPPAQRKQIAKTITHAAKTLVANGGTPAIRALSKITRSVKRTAGARGTSAALQPRVVARTAAKVAQNPQLLRRLSAPSPHGQALVRRAGGIGDGIGGDMGFGLGAGTGVGSSRTINIPGPATITIQVG